MLIIGVVANGDARSVQDNWSKEDKKRWREWRIWLANILVGISDAPILLFASSTDVQWINDAIRYCDENESSQIIKIVHFTPDAKQAPADFTELVQLINKCYPRFRIDATVVEGEFSPDMVREIAEFFGMSRHSTFLGCPGVNFEFSMADFGGARIITGPRGGSKERAQAVKVIHEATSPTPGDQEPPRVIDMEDIPARPSTLVVRRSPALPPATATGDSNSAATAQSREKRMRGAPPRQTHVMVVNEEPSLLADQPARAPSSHSLPDDVSREMSSLTLDDAANVAQTASTGAEHHAANVVAAVWKEQRNPDTGRMYYVHTITSEQTWVKPDALVIPLESEKPRAVVVATPLILSESMPSMSPVEATAP
jgi:hypothetical protein